MQSGKEIKTIWGVRQVVEVFLELNDGSSVQCYTDLLQFCADFVDLRSLIPYGIRTEGFGNSKM